MENGTRSWGSRAGDFKVGNKHKRSSARKKNNTEVERSRTLAPKLDELDKFTELIANACDDAEFLALQDTSDDSDTRKQLHEQPGYKTLEDEQFDQSESGDPGYSEPLLPECYALKPAIVEDMLAQLDAIPLATPLNSRKSHASFDHGLVLILAFNSPHDNTRQHCSGR
jgi:hypothetical protein